MSEVRKFATHNYSQADLKAMSIQALVTLHNQLASKPVNRFSDRKTAEKRVWALGSPAAPAAEAPPSKSKTDATEKAPKTRTPRKARVAKEPSERRVRLKTFRLAPADTLREPREGTKRAEVLRLLGRENGAKFSEIMEKIQWDEKTAYEGIRLIHVQCGYGLYHVDLPNDDYRIFLAATKAEFRELAAKYKDAAK